MIRFDERDGCKQETGEIGRRIQERIIRYDTVPCRLSDQSKYLRTPGSTWFKFIKRIGVVWIAAGFGKRKPRRIAKIPPTDRSRLPGYAATASSGGSLAPVMKATASDIV